LDAAVRVFARKGFHASRVGDIAEEAGVAHGLLYHYFRSKEEVLETIFSEVWELLAADTDRIEHADVPLREQLRRFARIYLGSWLMTPDLIAVLVREIARSPVVGNRVDDVGVIFRSLQRMIASAQERGEVRADCDPRLAAWVVTVVDVAYAGLAA
jgi:TetR/AcrR family fatty acid metabolism transcriptional regulator